MVKIFPIVFLCTSFFGCEAEAENSSLNINIQTNQNESTRKDTMSTEKLMSLSKVEAVKAFGEPSFAEQFVLDDAQGEFRNGISDAFTAKEKQQESILIEEVTWEKDENTWITVWYHVEADQLTPKSSLEWDKGSEF